MSHQHDHDHTEPPADIELRVRALESLLQEKGLIDPAALDELIDTYEHKVGLVTARRWSLKRGVIRSINVGCWRTPQPPSPSWVSPACRVKTCR